MRFFLIEEDKKIIQKPYIMNWHDKLDVRDICSDSAHKLPERELLLIRSNQDTMFTDIISTPFFLLSEKIIKTIKMYEPKIRTKEIVLLDKVYGKAERYFLPLFEALDCLDGKSEFNLDHNEIKKIVLNWDKVKGHNVFQIANIRRQYVIGNLDVVESILKRGCLGIQLTELPYML